MASTFGSCCGTRKFTPAEALASLPPPCDAAGNSRIARHRSIGDIKPENLLLRQGGRVRSPTSGIAKITGAG